MVVDVRLELALGPGEAQLLAELQHPGLVGHVVAEAELALFHGESDACAEHRIVAELLGEVERDVHQVLQAVLPGGELQAVALADHDGVGELLLRAEVEVHPALRDVRPLHDLADAGSTEAELVEDLRRGPQDGGFGLNCPELRGALLLSF